MPVIPTAVGPLAKRRLEVFAVATAVSALLVTGIAFLILSAPNPPARGAERTDVASKSAFAPQGAAVAAAPTSARTWSTTAEWDGRGVKETESFATHGREWRVRWRTSNEPFKGAGIMQLFVYRAEDGDLEFVVANLQGKGAGESYVQAEPGSHYLLINSENLDWTVTVEERR